MELIKELGSRTTISSTGKQTSRKWGVFKCPSCGIEKEYNIQKGRSNKTCGAKTCRKQQANYNPWNKGMESSDKIKNLPYYSSFSSYYRSLLNKNYTLGWSTLKEFRDDMYTEYAELRTSGNTRLTLESSGNVLSKSTCKWVTEYNKVTDFSKDRANGIKHSLMLEAETSVSHNIIARTILKMDASFGECEYITVTSVGNVGRPTKAYKLSEYQYSRLKDRLLDNAQRKVSSHIYLINCEGYTKIGVTHDVDKRLGALRGSAPFKYNVIYNKYIGNALSTETYLHNKYSKFNHHHEWFNLTEDQVKEIIAYLDNKE